MRSVWLVPLLFLAVPVVGHEGDHDCTTRDFAAMNHINLWVDDIPAGGNLTRTLGFDGCPLSEGWWMFVWSQTAGPLAISMEHEGAALAAWTADSTTLRHMQIPETGYPTLRLDNPGTEAVRFQLYFDQTCDCASKATFVDGPLWLNIPAEAGDSVRFDLEIMPFWPQPGDGPPLPDNLRLRLSRAVPAPGGPILSDAEVIEFNPRQATDCDPYIEGELCTSYSFKADATGMQYVWAEVEDGTGDGWMVRLLITTDVQKEAPAPWWAALGLLVAAAMRRQTLSRRD